MITKNTATDIALAYREIERAEELLIEVEKTRKDTATHQDLRDAFGRPARGLELAVPSGTTGHRLFDVPWSIAKPIILAHIAHHRSRIAILTEAARCELAGDVGAAPAEEPR